YSRKTLFPYRRGCAAVPAARVRVAILGDGVSPTEAGEEQHRSTDVSAQGRGKRPAYQEVAVRRGLHDCRGAPAPAGRSEERQKATAVALSGAVGRGDQAYPAGAAGNSYHAVGEKLR